MSVKKIYQCEECKNYFEEKEVVELHNADNSGKAKKMYVCKTCYEKKINKN